MTSVPEDDISATPRRRLVLAAPAAGDAPRPVRDLEPRRPNLAEAIRVLSLVNLTVALVFGAIAAGGAAAFTLTRQATFQSHTAVLLNHPDIARLSTVNPIVRLDALRRTYAAVARTEQVVVPVANDTGLPAPIVQRSTSVVVNADSLIIYPTARGSDRETSQKLANALSTELANYVTRSQDEAGVPADDRVTLTLIDHARRGAKIAPTAKDAVSAAVLAGGLGIALGYVLLQIITADRRTAPGRAAR